MPSLLQRLTELAAIDAVSGHEAPLLRHLRDTLSGVCDEVEVDAVGNLYALRRGERPGPTVMIAAHTDEIGLIVKAVEPSGFLRIETIGGVIASTLPARLVRVRGHLGVVGVKAGHYQTPAERERAPAIADLYVDVGAASPASVAAMGIGVGDPIAFVCEVRRFGHDAPLVVGKAIDDRLGCAILAQLVEDGPPSAGTLVAAFTSQEEVGLKGAGVAGTRWQPDLAVALDTMPSGDTPDLSRTRDLDVAIGAGPVVQVSAGAGGRGFLVHQGVRRYLRSLAEAAGVPLQEAVFAAGNNDAAAIAWSGRGVSAASLCLPRRYSHSPVEVADMRDAESALALLRALVARMGELPRFDVLEG